MNTSNANNLEFRG